MPSPFAIYTPRSTSLGPLVGVADGYLSEDHEIGVDVTRFPVESGATLGDHAVKRPDHLRLVGWTSDLYPRDPTHISETDRPARAWAEIRKILADREPLEVITILGVYENMVMTRAAAPVTHQTGRGLLFTLEFEEVPTAPLQRVEFAIRPTAGPAEDRSEFTAAFVGLGAGDELATSTLAGPPTPAAAASSVATGDELATAPYVYSPTVFEVQNNYTLLDHVGEGQRNIESSVRNVEAELREGDILGAGGEVIAGVVSFASLLGRKFERAVREVEKDD